MGKHLVIMAMAVVGLVGCGQVTEPDQSAPTTTRPRSTTSGPASSPTTGTVPVTTQATTTPSPATTTTQALPRAEATAKLCTGVGEADERIQRGSFVSGGLRLSGTIAANEKAADPAVVSAARSMLRVGVNGDAEGYVTARQAASTACARAGYPIRLGGPIMCVRAPCP